MTLDDLIAQVTAETDVVTGLAAAVDTIIAQEAEIKAALDAAIAGGADPVKLQAIADALGSNTATLAAKRDAIGAAVIANTIAAP
jgi:hypothetical protein